MGTQRGLLKRSCDFLSRDAVRTKQFFERAGGRNTPTSLASLPDIVQGLPFGQKLQGREPIDEVRVDLRGTEGSG